MTPDVTPSRNRTIPTDGLLYKCGRSRKDHVEMHTLTLLSGIADPGSNAPEPTKPSICVAICTRNRANSLNLTLSSLNALTIPKGWSIEYAFVDNGSTDNTRAVLADFASSAPLHANIVSELRPGLSAARNAALRATRADFIAFTDDDCLPEPDWLLQICTHFSSSEGTADLVGGRVELYDSTDLPITINTSTQARVIEQASMNLTSIMGCNFAFHRKVFEDIGMFDEQLGAGARFVSAEDTDFLYRALRAGFRIAYEPKIVVRHNHGRRTETEREKLMRGYAIGRGALYCKHWRAGDPLALRSMVWDVRESLLASVDRHRAPAHRKLCRSQAAQVIQGFLQALPHYKKAS